MSEDKGINLHLLRIAPASNHIIFNQPGGLVADKSIIQPYSTSTIQTTPGLN